MILGTGVDIIEIKRVDRMIRRRPFPRKIFSREEISACQEEGLSRKRVVSRLAGLFAGKEAVMKALGTGWTGGAAWTDISISHTAKGQPLVTLHGDTHDIAAGKGVVKVHLSISHCDEFALACAVLEGKK